MVKRSKKNSGCTMKGGKSAYPFAGKTPAAHTPSGKIVMQDGVPQFVESTGSGKVISSSQAMMAYKLNQPLVTGGGKKKTKTTKKPKRKTVKKTTKKTTKKTKRKIHKGPRGGRYYMSKGRKVYV